MRRKFTNTLVQYILCTPTCANFYTDTPIYLLHHSENLGKNLHGFQSGKGRGIRKGTVSREVREWKKLDISTRRLKYFFKKLKTDNLHLTLSKKHVHIKPSTHDNKVNIRLSTHGNMNIHIKSYTLYVIRSLSTLVRH